MNTKRITFWAIFIVVLGLIVWGLVAAMNRPGQGGKTGEPAPISADDHSIGKADAPVTVIEYSDFQCPACETYYPVVKKLIEESSSTMRFAYRHFPLNDKLPNGTIQHPNAIASAMAAEAAGLQGKFWEMSDLIFTNHTEWTEESDPTPVFLRYATQLGLDKTKFLADLNNPTLRQKIDAQKSEGTRIGVSYTPSFFVNGKLINNPPTYDEFKSIIESAAKGNTI
jgi:protein-disulfide isomerase